mmetsp:Transcript_12996/g.36604  ORF Transcript_12996/g.36604 Transcript_12996/m.36604 type:complete len:94 (-) Transcript_12996:99-380(-)
MHRILVSVDQETDEDNSTEGNPTGVTVFVIGVWLGLCLGVLKWYLENPNVPSHSKVNKGMEVLPGTHEPPMDPKNETNDEEDPEGKKIQAIPM